MQPAQLAAHKRYLDSLKDPTPLLDNHNDLNPDELHMNYLLQTHRMTEVKNIPETYKRLSARIAELRTAKRTDKEIIRIIEQERAIILTEEILQHSGVV